MNNATKSILLAGVGGQGILRASDILSMVIIEAGYDVKKSEVHGMAQRGGSVTSHVRFGEKVFSPIARKADVEILLSFEKLETLRYLDYLKPGATVIINDVAIYPPSVNLGDAKYPENITEVVTTVCNDIKIVDASAIAGQAGNPRTANVALLGVLSLYLDLGVDHWDKVLRRSFSPKVLEANLHAFNLGRNV